MDHLQKPSWSIRCVHITNYNHTTPQRCEYNSNNNVSQRDINRPIKYQQQQQQTPKCSKWIWIWILSLLIMYILRFRYLIRALSNSLFFHFFVTHLLLRCLYCIQFLGLKALVRRAERSLHKFADRSISISLDLRDQLFLSAHSWKANNWNSRRAKHPRYLKRLVANFFRFYFFLWAFVWSPFYSAYINSVALTWHSN